MKVTFDLGRSPISHQNRKVSCTSYKNSFLKMKLTISSNHLRLHLFHLLLLFCHLQGLSYICQVGADVVLDKLRRRQLPPQTGSDGDLSYSFSNMRVTHVEAPRLRTPLDKGEGVNVDLEGLGVGVEGHWKLTFQ